MLNKPLALLFVLVNHCVFPVYAGVLFRQVRRSR